MAADRQQMPAKALLASAWRYNGCMFKDHFSGHASSYNRYRPDYPDALFKRLVAHCADTGTVWDCATGSGQAARALAAYFDRVIASDASLAQVREAGGPSNIVYTAALAESSGIATSSLDLATVAQSLHWFDFERFGAEMQRVLKPGAPLAAWCYGLLEIEDDIDAVIAHFYADTVGAYWPPERDHVDTAYRNIDLALETLADESFSSELQWTLDSLLGYIGTWSACQRFTRDRGVDPLLALRKQLQPLWGEPGSARRMHWPIRLRLWRNR